MEREEFNCDLAQDLIPLALDGKISEDSRHFLDGHLQTCQRCREIQESMRVKISEGMLEKRGQKQGRKRKRRSLEVMLGIFFVCYTLALILLLALIIGVFTHWGLCI